MDYEAELDAQIEALEKEIDRRKRIRAFWEKSIPDTEKLLKKWRVMCEHMRDENNIIEVSMNLEIEIGEAQRVMLSALWDGRVNNNREELLQFIQNSVKR